MRAKTKLPGGFDLSPDILIDWKNRTSVRTEWGVAGEESMKYPG